MYFEYAFNEVFKKIAMLFFLYSKYLPNEMNT
jgi:hypothetical protein